jgi:hypothetical protein
MVSRTGLYYPFLTVQNDNRLKTSALFYDKLLRITPMKGFYKEPPSVIQCELQDSLGFIKDIEFINEMGQLKCMDAVFHSCSFLYLMLKHATEHRNSPFRYLIEARTKELSPYFDWGGYERTKVPGCFIIELIILGALHEDPDGFRFEKIAGMTYMALLANPKTSVIIIN